MLILLFALFAAWAPTMPAHAAARHRSATSDTLTLSLTNGPTLPYSSSSVFHFVAVATLAAPLTAGMSLSLQAYLLESGQSMAYAVSQSTFAGPDGVTFTMPIDLPATSYGLMPGPHTVYARIINPDTKVATTSNTVSFTISPIYSGLMCGVGSSGANINGSATWTPGQTVTIAMQNETSDPNVPLDWTKGTATITLTGPKTFTYPNLSLDSNGATTFPAPTTVGRYEMDCKVSGVPYYTFGDSLGGVASYLVSESKALGGVKLYTNPTTLVVNQATQMYVVFLAAPGLPTPTGEFVIYIGQGAYFYYTQSIKIGSSGTAFVKVGALPNLYSANNITVHYFGDPYYKDQSVNFTLTNPAIPGSGGGGTTPGHASATATPHAKATASATGTAPASSGATSGGLPSATPTAGSSPSVLGSFGPLSGGGMVALLMVIALLVVGSSAGTFVLLSRRSAARASLGGASMDPPPPPPSPSGPPFNDDTLPRQRVDPQWPPRQ